VWPELGKGRRPVEQRRRSSEPRRRQWQSRQLDRVRGPVAVPYALYLESGPQKKTTLVHVLELLGCVATGKTSDDAVAAAPGAIQAYLRFLERHGERIDAGAKIETRIAEHNTEGLFSGQAIWPQDLKPLAPTPLRRYLRWLDWSRADLLALVKGIGEKHLRAKPSKGRSLREILLHVLDADRGYVYALVGPLKPMGEPTNAALKDALDLRVALAEARSVAIDRLRGLTPAERRTVRKAGQSTYSAHRVIRRMLEHEWEHRWEIAARLGKDA
jgi:predicted RNase H-like HicB family nuclease/uncharacterized damage-inducible protein DinB